MVNLVTWSTGRQNSGYLTKRLYQFKNCDCYLIKYPVGSKIDNHVDPVADWKHYRINITLWAARHGGIFHCDVIEWKLFNRIVCFRPDKFEHSVSEVRAGVRYVLSFGWKKK